MVVGWGWGIKAVANILPLHLFRALHVSESTLAALKTTFAVSSCVSCYTNFTNSKITFITDVPGNGIFVLLTTALAWDDWHGSYF